MRRTAQLPDHEDLASAQKQWSPGQSITPKMPCPHGVIEDYARQCKDCVVDNRKCGACGQKQLHHTRFNGLCPPKGWKP